MKANRSGIEVLYQATKRMEHTKDLKHLTMHDACEVLALAGFDGSEYEKIVACAYSLSKMTIIDEMEHFDKYN
jgi:hypothetical protein